MITVVADTHRREDHRLAGGVLAAVRDADVVVHAGDFTTASVLDAFEAEADRLAAVRGNNDDSTVRARLPAERVVEHEGATIGIVHGHDHSATALGLYAREVGADLVVVGHSHRPGVELLDRLPVVNPGSHAEPRQYRPGYATLTVASGTLRARVLEPDGTLIDAVSLATGSGKTDR